jgi:hypothetical protein
LKLLLRYCTYIKYLALLNSMILKKKNLNDIKTDWETFTIKIPSYRIIFFSVALYGTWTISLGSVEIPEEIPYHSQFTRNESQCLL